jgi:hypothetical protein
MIFITSIIVLLLKKKSDLEKHEWLNLYKHCFIDMMEEEKAILELKERLRNIQIEPDEEWKELHDRDFRKKNCDIRKMFTSEKYKILFPTHLQRCFFNRQQQSLYH